MWGLQVAALQFVPSVVQKLRADVAMDLSAALGTMEVEMKKVYEIGGLPHFHALEEDVSPLHIYHLKLLLLLTVSLIIYNPWPERSISEAAVRAKYCLLSRYPPDKALLRRRCTTLCHNQNYIHGAFVLK